MFTVIVNLEVFQRERRSRLLRETLERKYQSRPWHRFNVRTSDLWYGQELVLQGKRFCRNWNLERKRRSLLWETEPEKMHIIDTVTVDARTVNDVKVSENGEVVMVTVRAHPTERMDLSF